MYLICSCGSNYLKKKKQPKLNKAFAKETLTGLYYVDPFKVVDENTEEEIRDSC